MGLSSDPEKRLKQLANLESGRRIAAKNLLTEPPAEPRRGADSPRSAHTYPGPEELEEPDAGATEPAPAAPADEDERPGRAGGFLAGLRAGFAD